MRAQRKIAIYIVENADIVSNVCNDVIGDIFGILSGACTVVITASVTKGLDTVTGKLVAVAVSAIISAIIVGGKPLSKPVDYEIYGTRHYVFKGTFGTFARKTKEKRNENPRKNKDTTMRLDLFILQKFNLKSRSFAENLIKKGKVNVNNVTLKSRRTTFRTTTKSKFSKRRV